MTGTHHRLDAAELLERAQVETGASDWGDPTLPELNTQAWSSSNLFTGAMYSRIFYQVALANQFLRETTDAKLSSRGVSAQLGTW